VELTYSEGDEVIFDDYVKPDEGIWLFIPRHDDTTLFLYENDMIVETKTYTAW